MNVAYAGPKFSHFFNVNSYILAIINALYNLYFDSLCLTIITELEVKRTFSTVTNVVSFFIEHCFPKETKSFNCVNSVFNVDEGFTPLY